MRDLVVVGAGGFGRETIDVVSDINAEGMRWYLIGIVDDAPSEKNLERLRASGAPYLGAVDRIPTDASVVVAVGSPAIRRSIVARVRGSNADFPSLIHPTAVVGGGFVHGSGLVVLAGACIGTNVRVGDHVHVNGHAVVGHDVVLGDMVSLNPNSTVSGEVTVGDECLIGAASVILQGLTIAGGATVGAAACVVRDVSTPDVVKGVPAR